MSSDFKKYGAIKDGKYDCKWVPYTKKDGIPKNYLLNDGDAIDTIDGNRNPGPDRYSDTQKDAIFLHRTNMDGKAWDPVSKGCLLIKASQWNEFENKMGKNPFKIILQRK